MKTTRPMKYIILIVVLLGCFGLKAQKTIVFDGIEVNLDELSKAKYDIGFNINPNPLKSTSIEANSIPNKILYSTSKNCIALNKLYKEHPDSVAKSFLKMYNQTGNEQWSVDLGHNAVVQSWISNRGVGGAYLIGSITEDPFDSGNTLIFIDNKGEVLFEVKDYNTTNYTTTPQKDLFYYHIVYPPHEKETIHCYDLKQKRSWSYNFNDYNVLCATSYNGDFSVIGTKEQSYLFSRNGKLLNTVEMRKTYNGPTAVSNDGKLLLILNSSTIPPKISIYNFKTDKLVACDYSIPDNEFLSGKRVQVYSAMLVQTRLETEFAVSFDVDFKIRLIAIYKEGGILVGYEMFEDDFQNTEPLFIIKKSKNKYDVILNDDLYGHIDTGNVFKKIKIPNK